MANKKTNAHINPVVAGVAGAIVGASVGAAGAMALTDKKSRQKVENVMNIVKDKAVEYVEELEKNKNVQKGTKAVANTVTKAVGTKKIAIAKRAVKEVKKASK